MQRRGLQKRAKGQVDDIDTTVAVIGDKITLILRCEQSARERSEAR